MFARRTRVHRALGYAGLATAFLVIVFGAIVTIAAVPRGLAGRLPPEAIPVIFTGNLITLVSFMAFVGLAFHWRRRPENHKRMMYFATVSIIGPAFGTAGQRPLGPLLAELFPRPGIVVPITLVVCLLAYDLLRDSRLRPVSLWAGLAVVAKPAVNQLILAPSDLVRTAVWSLG